MRVVIAAGGTAGHVFPGLALAERLRDRFGADVLFVGRTDGREAELVPAAGFRLRTVAARPFVRRISVGALAAPLAALRAARRCRPLVREADVVVSMGGYVGVPVSLAAWRARRPLVLHEQNAVPGLANRVASRWARVVALGFEEAGRGLPRRVRTVVTGNPVREAVLRVAEERETLRAEAFRAFDLRPERKTVVIFGGSQGALHLDRVAVPAVRELSGAQVLLITGPHHQAEAEAALAGLEEPVVRVHPFVERMELAYAMADLVVARAGASTIAELSACGVPALLVPYPYATGRHQEANARALQRAGGAAILLDDQLSPGALAERLEELLSHEERLRTMADRSARFGRPDAADALAETTAEATK